MYLNKLLTTSTRVSISSLVVYALKSSPRIQAFTGEWRIMTKSTYSYTWTISCCLPKNKDFLNTIVSNVCSKFAARAEPIVTQFLVLSVMVDKSSIFICTAGKIKRILKEFNMKNSCTALAPLPAGTILSRAQQAKFVSEKDEMATVRIESLCVPCCILSIRAVLTFHTL